MRRVPVFASIVIVGMIMGTSVCSARALRGHVLVRAASAVAGQDKTQQGDLAKLSFPSLGDSIEHIKPASSGAGVVICEPESEQGVDSETANFGAGCGRWLQFVVGGQGELGKTPLWEGLDRARRELGRSDLRLKSAEIPRLATMLGITHAACGTIRGAAGKCTLTYQLWQIAGQKPAGPPVAATGSTTQILVKLPSMAIALSRQLGIASPRIPATVGTTPQEIATLGGLSLGTNYGLTDPQIGQLNAIAAHTPLAAMFLLDTLAAEDRRELASVVKTCLETAPANTLIYCQIGTVKPERLVPCQANLLELCRKYPLNAPLALAASRLFYATTQPEQERRYAENAVHASYNGADSWLALAAAYMMEAQYVRRSRTFGSLSTEEAAYDIAADNLWIQASMRAAQQDDRHARAWLAVAKAATFASQANIGDLALTAAMRLEPSDPQVYISGLQMYQPKWRNDPVRLRAVAEKAAKVQFASTGHSILVVDALKVSGFPELAKQLRSAVIARQEEVVRNRPNDVLALRLLGSACFRTNRYPDGLAAYRKVADLTPDDPRAQFELGSAQQLNSQLDQAIASFRQTIRLAPDHIEARGRLASLLQFVRKNPEAIAAYQELLRLSPRNQSAYEQLAALLLEAMRAREAIQAARSAIELNGGSASAHEILGEAYLLDRQFDASVVELREALRLNPNDQRAKQKLEEALNK